ncbi:MAG: glutamine--tRNA ligase, partial [Clostridia bacterium]
SGIVTAVYCTVDMDSRNGSEGASRKVKGTLHWVSATESLPFEARLYEPLLMDESDAEAALAADTEESDIASTAPTSSSTLKTDFLKTLNRGSLETCCGYMESYLATAQEGETFQFLRMGYYCK